MAKINSDLIFSVIIISVVVLVSSLIIFGPFSISAVSTNSMEPTHEGFLTKNGEFNYFKGDLLILENKNPEIGDIILFNAPKTGDLFLHRIVAERTIDGNSFFATKGDNNIFTDVFTYDPETSAIPEEQIHDLGWIPSENILGVVVISVPLAGGLLNSIFYPVGIFILVLITLVGVLLYLKRTAILKIKQIKSFQKILEKLDLSLKLSKRNILISKNYVITFLIVSTLLLSFFSVNFFYHVTNSSDIELLTRENEKFPNTINLTNIHTFSSEDYDIDGKQVFFYNAKLIVHSKSIFSSVKSIILTTQYKNENYTNYDENVSNYSKINFVYGFNGIKTLNTILIFIDPFSFNSSIDVEVIISVSYYGLFADRSLEKTYEAILK